MLPAMDASTVRQRDLAVPNSDIWSTPMNMQPQFETTREVTAISKMLADLVHTVELIESDIADEEERANISDQSDARYSMLAMSLIERRNNIRMTIAVLGGVDTSASIGQWQRE
jgi:hypothetical protein